MNPLPWGFEIDAVIYHGYSRIDILEKGEMSDGEIAGK